MPKSKDDNSKSSKNPLSAKQRKANQLQARSKEKKDSPYSVGYKRPPIHSQFKPGVSGNPRGKPKHTKRYLAMVHEAGLRPITMTVGGVLEEMSIIEACIMKAFEKASQGDYKMLRMLRDDFQKREAEISNSKNPTIDNDSLAMRIFSGAILGFLNSQLIDVLTAIDIENMTEEEKQNLSDLIDREYESYVRRGGKNYYDLDEHIDKGGKPA